ncbi:MAG: UDP-glucose/GDP-mannose dehydrogenase family protein [Gammaproteobacteria bacterium]|nr:UDP-glucose/GDP-mannose dehydrogenase family protein [Gammaproteobacteria bacterium]MYJ52489.1 UDP-glucose/GDP-mannose dehydrogenase family protein [Gammaproteobacteria bacterium]
MKTTIIGTGYVGLVTGACFAEMGNDVLCVDRDRKKIEGLKRGVIPIHEQGLSEMVQDNLASGRLRFTTEIAEGVEQGQVIFIAVGTPSDENGGANLANVDEVARSIGESLDGFRVVVTKSTVPVGTARRVESVIRDAVRERGGEADFAVVSNPEFLKEGVAVKDFMKPDRIILGGDDSRALNLLRELYAPFNRNHDRLIVMDVVSAELTKYAANSMLATKISFMNEMSRIAEQLGADIESVRIGIGSDPRIGYDFIYAGCGFGGSCLPKDIRALVQTAASTGYRARVLEAVDAVNREQKRVLADRITERFGSDLSGRTFALWGLAFKPDTDDIREAPSRVIMEALWEYGATVRAYDPVAVEAVRKAYGERPDLLLYSEDPYEALEGADCLIIATEWKVFRGIDLARVRDTLSGNLVVDGRNMFSPEAVTQAGLEYYGVGRGQTV